MLAGKDFGRGEQCRLRPALDCDQHRLYRDGSLA